MNTKTVLQEITELRGLAVPELVAKYREVLGREPRVRHREFLWKRIAHALQTQRLGGLSKLATRRLEQLIGEIDLPLADGSAATGSATAADNERRSSSATKTPTAGTVLVRMWHGREVRVEVLDRGFEHDGVVYRSLSAVAKALTGSHWNGRLFFGLSGRSAGA